MIEGCETEEAAWEEFRRVRQAMDSSVREWSVAPSWHAPEIRRYLEAAFTFEDPRQAGELVSAVAALLKDGTVHVTHPRYFGLFIPSVRRISVVAEALAAHFNPQLAAWSHAPAANEIERHTLAFLLEKLGLDVAHGGGCFTSGGMEANLTALLTALCDAFPTLRESGLVGLQARPRFYVSAEAHHSFEKAATVTGLGVASLVRIPVDDSLRMNVSALQRAIARDRAAGAVPFLVVGTAGTTGAGAIDPLARLAALAEKQGLWFHVDAAWGGFARLSPRHRDHLDGIQSADSVTWDAHKGLAVPLGAGMFLCRDRAAMTRTFALATGYMPAATTGASIPMPQACSGPVDSSGCRSSWRWPNSASTAWPLRSSTSSAWAHGFAVNCRPAAGTWLTPLPCPSSASRVPDYQGPNLRWIGAWPNSWRGAKSGSRECRCRVRGGCSGPASPVS